MEKSAESKHRERSRGDAESGGCCSLKLWWWNPPQQALVSEYFNDTSLHGLKYIGQPKRHITERIFWFIAFVIGLVAAGILINAMILRFENTPVVVSFKSNEQLIETIPFPAITFCNINQFSKKKVQELERVSLVPTHEDYEMATRNLSLIKSFCNTQNSWASENSNIVDFGRSVVETSDDNKYGNVEEWDIHDFMTENTPPCEQMIKLCVFEGRPNFDCWEFFESVITEFGKCCTFNMLPLPMLWKNPSNEGKKNTSPLQDFMIDKWSKWNYDNGFKLPRRNYHLDQPDIDASDIALVPFRQNGPGKAFGFSILLDPNTDDYYCPMSNGEGIFFKLHTAIELPNVKEFPSAIDTNKEAYIKVFPELTFADNDIRDLKSKQRQCYFGKEKKLKLFYPYTRENCIDECTADYIYKECDCALFYMPRDDDVEVCNTHVKSEDGKCVAKALGVLRDLNDELCGHCLALCEDIEYRFEPTTVTLLNATKFWYDMGGANHKDKLLEWENHKVSIAHIFFGTRAVVPKLRKRLYGMTDLIANTGGILGLCLGFSVLSAAEVVYFVLVRALWKYCHRRRIYGLCRRSRKQTPASASITSQQKIEPAPIFQIPALCNKP